MSNVKMSIIVPVYNVGRFLRKCLDSLLDQTLKEIEIICINDGSTDNSLEILNESACKDTRIRVVSQENRGLGATRNVGIKLATGEYLGFVDSDDFVDSTMFEKLYEKAKKNDCDIAIVGIYIYNTINGQYWPFRDAGLYKKLSDAPPFTAAEYPILMQLIGVWDRIYKRLFIEEYSLINPEGRIYEDVLFTIQTSVLAKKITVVDEPLYYYRRFSGDSIVDRETREDGHKFDFLKNLKESKDFLLSLNVYQQFQKDFLMHQFHGINTHRHHLHGFLNFRKFMLILRGILDQSDYDFASSFDFGKGDRVFYKLLRKKAIVRAYICLKISHIYSSDNFYITIRIPKTDTTFMIKRRKFYFYTELQRQEWISGELVKLNKNLEAIDHKLSCLIK